MILGGLLDMHELNGLYLTGIENSLIHDGSWRQK